MVLLNVYEYCYLLEYKIKVVVVRVGGKNVKFDMIF